MLSHYPQGDLRDSQASLRDREPPGRRAISACSGVNRPIFSPRFLPARRSSFWAGVNVCRDFGPSARGPGLVLVIGLSSCRADGGELDMIGVFLVLALRQTGDLL